MIVLQLNYSSVKLMRIYVFSIWVLMFMAISCNPSSSQKTNQIAALEKEVLAIHDEVMPRMGQVVMLADKLDSLTQAARNTNDSLTYANIAQQLHKADQDMMHWMRGYKIPEQATDSAVIGYLNHQKALVDSLRVHIYQAIKNGQVITP